MGSAPEVQCIHPSTNPRTNSPIHSSTQFRVSSKTLNWPYAGLNGPYHNWASSYLSWCFGLLMSSYQYTCAWLPPCFQTRAVGHGGAQARPTEDPQRPQRGRVPVSSVLEVHHLQKGAASLTRPLPNGPGRKRLASSAFCLVQGWVGVLSYRVHIMGTCHDPGARHEDQATNHEATQWLLWLWLRLWLLWLLLWLRL